MLEHAAIDSGLVALHDVLDKLTLFIELDSDSCGLDHSLRPVAHQCLPSNTRVIDGQ